MSQHTLPIHGGLNVFPIFAKIAVIVLPLRVSIFPINKFFDEFFGGGANLQQLMPEKFGNTDLQRGLAGRTLENSLLTAATEKRSLLRWILANSLLVGASGSRRGVGAYPST